MWWTAKEAVAVGPPVKNIHGRKEWEERRWPPPAGVLAS
jgi:hypothetical protein